MLGNCVACFCHFLTGTNMSKNYWFILHLLKGKTKQRCMNIAFKKYIFSYLWNLKYECVYQRVISRYGKQRNKCYKYTKSNSSLNDTCYLTYLRNCQMLGSSISEPSAFLLNYVGDETAPLKIQHLSGRRHQKATWYLDARDEHVGLT